MAFAGMLFAVYPFLASMKLSEKAKNNSWRVYDLSDMKPGQLRKLGQAWAYRRTASDFESYDKLKTIYQDPDMAESEQPDTAMNQWRSPDKDFLVFLPWAPVRGCAVIFVEPGTETYEYYEDGQLIAPHAHFREMCEWRIFDTTGRLLARGQWPPENNLTIPEMKWESSRRVQIFGG